MKKTTMIAAAAAAGLAGSAMASTLQDTATVDGLGGAVTMKAFDFSGTVFGGATPPNFTTSSLASMHTLISDDVETDNKVTFVLDATLGLINIEQNATIKIFSVVAVVFLPPTLIASIYGMNFEHMPELNWWFGYPLAILAMIGSSILPYLFFKRRGWL